MSLPAAAVIPTLNEAETIHLSVEGLANQSHPVGKVFLMDGGSTDGTIAKAQSLAEDHDLDLVVGQREGANIGVACAAGIYQAGEWFDSQETDGVIVRTDADSVLANNWVETAVGALEEDDVTLFGSVSRPLHRLTGGFVRTDQRLVRSTFAAISNLFSKPKGRAMAFRWSDFNRVNGFCLCNGAECSCGPEWYEDSVITEKLKMEGRSIFSRRTWVYSEMPSTTLSKPQKWMPHEDWHEEVRESDWTPEIEI